MLVAGQHRPGGGMDPFPGQQQVGGRNAQPLKLHSHGIAFLSVWLNALGGYQRLIADSYCTASAAAVKRCRQTVSPGYGNFVKKSVKLQRPSGIVTYYMAPSEKHRSHAWQTPSTCP